MERRPPRTLALWCPDWPVVAAGADPDRPAAVLDGEGARRVVAACTPAARESGVRRGQRLRDAQRLCPQLEVYRRDPAREAREFEPVVLAAEDLAAGVELVRPGLIALDARGPARYHGGEQRLAVLLREAVAELSTAGGAPIGCGIGIADGMFAAALAARRAPEDAPVTGPEDARATGLEGVQANELEGAQANELKGARATRPEDARATRADSARAIGPEDARATDLKDVQVTGPEAAPTEARPADDRADRSRPMAAERSRPTAEERSGLRADPLSSPRVTTAGRAAGGGLPRLGASERGGPHRLARLADGVVTPAAYIVPPGGSAAFLAPYPVAVLEWGREPDSEPDRDRTGRDGLAAALDRLGVRSLGAFADLPADAVAGRFGTAGTTAHRLARGLDPRPPAARRPAEELTAVHAFDPPAEHDEQAVFAAKTLAEELHERLARSGLACLRLGVELTTASGRVCHRLWRHGDPAGGRLSAAAVAERVRWQLDGWRAREPGRATPGETAETAETAREADAGGASGAAGWSGRSGAAGGSGESSRSEAAGGSGAAGWSGKSAASGARSASGTSDASGSGMRIGRGHSASDRADRGDADDYGYDSSDPSAGRDPLVLLRLIPDQLGVDTGSQQALWGREEVPGRVGRAAEHVQALLGHTAVLRPYLVGGRDPAARTGTVPWGDLPEADPDPAAPWPGGLPAPLPAAVPRTPYAAELCDASGRVIVVTGRGQLSAAPALLRLITPTGDDAAQPGPSADGRTVLSVADWAGPWLYDEQWWDPAAHRRRARLQVVTDDGHAWLLTVERGVWRIEGLYR